MTAERTLFAASLVPDDALSSPFLRWGVLALVALAAWVVSMLAARLTHAILERIAARTATSWDDRAIARLRAPVTLGWFVVVAKSALPLLALADKLAARLDRGLDGVAMIALFWGLARGVDGALAFVESSGWAKTHPSSRGLVTFGGRLAKLLVVALGAITLLSTFGFPITSLVAGLGLGGLAVGLAAQKTLENVFGGVSLAFDEPFRQGDFVKIDDVVGNVEAIGLRSTRVRTLDRTLVAIPNGKLADSRVECFTARDRIRLACTLGLVYATTADELRDVLARLERVLREHPKIWPDAVVVRFAGFGASSLDVDVMAWFQVTDYGEFQAIRQEVLLSFMAAVEAAGSSFAFPSRTVYLEKG